MEQAGDPEGIDLSLLEESLRLTPWERLLENDRALALIRMLEEAAAASHPAGATAAQPSLNPGP